MKENIKKDDNNKSEANDNREDPRDKNWGKDNSNMLDPERSNMELMSYCQCVLNRCVLITYMPKCCPVSCTGKATNTFTKNLLGFVI